MVVRAALVNKALNDALGGQNPGPAAETPANPLRKPNALVRAYVNEAFQLTEVESRAVNRNIAQVHDFLDTLNDLSQRHGPHALALMVKMTGFAACLSELGGDRSKMLSLNLPVPAGSKIFFDAMAKDPKFSMPALVQAARQPAPAFRELLRKVESNWLKTRPTTPEISAMNHALGALLELKTSSKPLRNWLKSLDPSEVEAAAPRPAASDPWAF